MLESVGFHFIREDKDNRVRTRNLFGAIIICMQNGEHAWKTQTHLFSLWPKHLLVKYLDVSFRLSKFRGLNWYKVAIVQIPILWIII